MPHCKTCQKAHAFHELSDGTCLECLRKERDAALAGLPDIGPDPLKLPTLEWSKRGDIEAVRAALSASIDKQQMQVPDQTALVWRIDVSRLLNDHTLLAARWKHLKPALDKQALQIQELKQFVTDVTGLTLAQTLGDEPVEKVLNYIKQHGQRVMAL